MQSNFMMRVAFFPKVEAYKDNPYWKLLESSLKEVGAELVNTNDKYYLQWQWLLRNRNQIEILHLHHLEPHYAADQHHASPKLFAKFIGKLLLARLLGYRIVWTLHNLSPHDPLEPIYVGRWTHLLVAQIAHVIIVHCEYARKALKTEFHRSRNVYTIPHPNFICVYPNSVTKKQAKEALGLTDRQKVFLYFGAIRPYKGIERLIEIFKEMPGENLALIIAGKTWNQEIGDSLMKSVGEDHRIHLILQYIPDESIQLYFNAADVAVLPFSNVLSSGSALLAMSFGRPVVAPGIGCLTETLKNGAGILYDPSDLSGLRKALQQSLTVDLDLLGKQAMQRIKELTWRNTAQMTLQAYRAAF